MFYKKIFLSFFLFFSSTISLSLANINDNTIEFEKVKNLIQGNKNEKLSFKEILDYTFVNNDNLNSEREKTKAIESLKFKTLGINALPNIGIDLNYGYTNFEENIGSTKLSDEGNTRSNKIYLQQPIFKSGRTLTQLSVINNQIEIQHNKLIQKEQETLFITIQATVEFLQTKEIFNITIRNEESLKNNYEYVLAKKKVGRSTISELSLAEARYSSAKTNTIKAATNFLNAKTMFLKITKIDSNNIDVNFDDIFVGSFNYNEKFDSILDSTLNRNPQYKIAKYNYEMNKGNLKFAKSSFLPELYLNAQLSESEKTELIDNKEASVSLNLRIPLFQSGTEYAYHREAHHLLNQAKFDLNDIKDSLMNETIITYDEFLSSKSLIVSSEAYRNSAKIALENSVIEEKVGKASIVDILDRRKEYLDTEILLLNYKSNVIKYYYALRMLMGELNLAEIFI